MLKPNFIVHKKTSFDFQNPYLTDSNKIQEVDLFFLTLKKSIKNISPVKK